MHKQGPAVEVMPVLIPVIPFPKAKFVFDQSKNSNLGVSRGFFFGDSISIVSKSVEMSFGIN